MDREALFAVLVVVVCGPTILAGSLLFGRCDRLRSGRRLEHACWVEVWKPLLPAGLLTAMLVGWALQEPEPADEFFVPRLLIFAVPFALIWVRAGFRAARSFFQTPDVPAATVGLLRPRVVLSPCLVKALDAPAIDAVSEHERAHAVHRDPLRIWLAQLATDLQWPWPAAEDRLRVWRHALEFARDDEARAGGVDGADLAAAILVATRLTTGGSGTAVARLSPDAAALRERVDRLLAEPAIEVAPRICPGRSPLLITSALLLAVLAGMLYGEAAVRALPGMVP